MDSETEEVLDLVEDSEPEREREARLKLVTDAFARANDSDEAESGEKGSEGEDPEEEMVHQPVASTSASVSRYFAPDPPPTASTSETCSRRRRKPWEQSPPALSRKISLPQPIPPIAIRQPSSPVQRKSRETLDRKERDGKKKRQQRLPEAPSSSSSSSSSGFQSASSLLQANLTLLDDEDTWSTKQKPVTSKAKAKSRSRKSKLSISSIEIIEPKGKESDEDQMDEDYDLPLPPPLDHDAFFRLLHDLPPLTPKRVNAETLDLDGDASDENSGQDITAVEKIRGGLSKFRYQLAHPTTSAVDPPPPSKPKRKPCKPPPASASDVKLPQSSRISVLHACPLCLITWSASKSLATKSTHIKNCATEKDYTSETVRILIEKQIMSKAKELETVRREKVMNRSLFDRIVGVGEGVTKNREITVVGVEPGIGTDVRKVQEELDEATRKSAVERLVKVAQEIKDERSIQREIEKKKRKPVSLVEDQENGFQDVDEFSFPQPTGMLRIASTGTRAAVSERAQDLLYGMRGTGLTQALFDPPPEPPASVLPPPPRLQPQPADPIVIDDDFDADPPRSTQGFEPSRLAEKLSKAGKIQVVKLPSKPISSIDSDSPTASLWEASVGLDDETIRKVVPVSFSSSPPQTPIRSNVPSVNSTPTSLRIQDQKVSPHHLHLATKMGGLALEKDGVDEGGMGEEEEMGPGLLVWDGGVDEENVGMEEGVLVWDGVVDEGEGEWSELEELMAEETTNKILSTKTQNKNELKTTTKTKPIPRTTNSKRTSKPSSRSPPASPPSDSFDFSSDAGPSDDDDNDTPLATKTTAASSPSAPPDYSSWTLQQLQTGVAQYGYRLSKEKSVMIDQLIKVWLAINPPPAVVSNAPVKRASKKKNGKEEVLEEEDEETVGEKIRKLIVGDSVIYSRVLRYEPIVFDDFLALAAANGIKCAKPLLMRCLDEQCVTFYIQDPSVGGTRKRYK